MTRRPNREFVSVHTDPAVPGVGTILLNRPPTNALTRQVYRELASAAEEAAGRSEIAAVILYGGHEIFCAGDDVPELRTLSAKEAGVGARVRHRAFEAVTSIPKPTVAAVTGYALGSGLTLALAADWRISGDNVKVGSTEILSGRAPAEGAAARLAANASREVVAGIELSGMSITVVIPPAAAARVAV